MNREDSCFSEFLKYLWQIPLPCWVTFPAIQGRRYKWLLLLHPSADRCQHRLTWNVSRTENAVWIKSELQLIQANVPLSGKCWRKPRKQTMPPFTQHETPSPSRMQSRQANAHCMDMVLLPHIAPQVCVALLLIYTMAPEIRIKPSSSWKRSHLEDACLPPAFLYPLQINGRLFLGIILSVAWSDSHSLYSTLNIHSTE